MEEEKTVLYKSFLFSQRVVRLYKYLLANGQPRSLADQVLRSGTSVGANMEEATGGSSRRDFIAKCAIAYKEARETHYWLRLFKSTDCLEPRLADSLLRNAEELAGCSAPSFVPAATTLTSRFPPPRLPTLQLLTLNYSNTTRRATTRPPPTGAARSKYKPGTSPAVDSTLSAPAPSATRTRRPRAS